jgi:hypothetical protein
MKDISEIIRDKVIDYYTAHILPNFLVGNITPGLYVYILSPIKNAL